MFNHDEVVITSDNRIGTRDQLEKSLNIRPVIFPKFDVVTSPSISLGDIRARRYNLIDRCK